MAAEVYERYDRLFGIRDRDVLDCGYRIARWPSILRQEPGLSAYPHALPQATFPTRPLAEAALANSALLFEWGL